MFIALTWRQQNDGSSAYKVTSLGYWSGRLPCPSEAIKNGIGLEIGWSDSVFAKFLDILLRKILLFSPNQFRFLPGRSTTTTLVDFLSRLLEDFEAKNPRVALSSEQSLRLYTTGHPVCVCVQTLRSRPVMVNLFWVTLLQFHFLERYIEKSTAKARVW